MKKSLIFLAPSKGRGLFLLIFLLPALSFQGISDVPLAVRAQQSSFTIRDIVFTKPSTSAGNEWENTDSFTPDDNFIRTSIRFFGNKHLIPLEVKWENEDSGVIIEKNIYTITKENGEASFKIKRPISGWPVGNYKISFIADNLVIAKKKFCVKKE